MRAYGQKDPLNEYKQEAFLMFEEMMRQIRETVSKIISFIEIKSEVPEPSSEIPEQNEKNPTRKNSRNAKCPCGSGKKYKHCCGKFN